MLYHAISKMLLQKKISQIFLYFVNVLHKSVFTLVIIKKLFFSGCLGESHPGKEMPQFFILCYFVCLLFCLSVL